MSKTVIIAEAGVNHNGYTDQAKKLIDTAASAGADYIKFQTFFSEKLVSLNAKKAKYQKQNFDDGNNTQFSMLKRLELTENDYYELYDYCSLKGIKFLSTGFDEDSIDFLEKLGLDYFKIPSGEIVNKPYLQHVAKKNNPVILSTGMSRLDEISDAMEILVSGGLTKDKITILHCNTEYPTPLEDVNLKAMLAIKNAFDVNIGYSDHTLGIEVPIAAVALGAKVIEKHFTLDRNLPGPDHKASLEPIELKAMVSSIRNIELAISGSGIKEASTSEIANIQIARRSIHYKRDLKKGDRINFSDIIMLRPGNGISPMEYEKCIGKILIKDVEEFQMLKWSDFQ